MNILVNNLLLFDSLNQQQIALVTHLTQEVHLKAGEYLAEPGNTFSQLALIESGVLRYNYYNRGAENITSGLIGEGNFVAGTGLLHHPFIQSDYLQAVTTCTLVILTKSGMDELSLTVPSWDGILKKIVQKATAERSSRIVRAAGNTDPENIAARYLAKFPDIRKHLSVNQMLQYLDPRTGNQQVR